MATIDNEPFTANTCEAITINFAMTGEDVSDAEAYFIISRRKGGTHILTVEMDTDGSIDVAADLITVSFNAFDLKNADDETLTGHFFGQLFVVKDDEPPRVVSNQPFIIDPVNT